MDFCSLLMDNKYLETNQFRLEYIGGTKNRASQHKNV